MEDVERLASRIDAEHGAEPVRALVARDAVEDRVGPLDEAAEGIRAVQGAVEVVDHGEIVAVRVDLVDDAGAVAAAVRGDSEQEARSENRSGVRIVAVGQIERMKDDEVVAVGSSLKTDPLPFSPPKTAVP